MEDIFENAGKTPLSQIGEFGLIRMISDQVNIYHSSTIRGIGDDAAVMDAGGKKVVVSTDLLTEGIHFDLIYTPLKHLGYKAIAVNLSDIYAMNARPAQVTVSIAISAKYTLEAIEELYSGILVACKNYQVDLVGGDTTSSTGGLTISVTAIGYANEEELVYRNGAQVNDLICVSGNLGAAYAGLQLMEREKRLFLENPNVQPDLEGYDYALERQLKPEPRADIIDTLRELGIKPTSMIDISDGLASELHHICQASGTGCRIDAERIPIDPGTWKVAEELQIGALTMALNGGEDYELLFTISQKDFDTLLKQRDARVIGYITDASEGLHIIDSHQQLHPIEFTGYQHK